MDKLRRAVIGIDRDRDPGDVVAEMGTAFVAAWNADEPSDPLATFTFASSSQLFSVITPKRWELIEVLQRGGPLASTGLASALGREVGGMEDDVGVLLDWGLVERTADGMLCVPFDVIHTQFDLSAAA